MDLKPLVTLLAIVNPLAIIPFFIQQKECIKSRIIQMIMFIMYTINLEI